MAGMARAMGATLTGAQKMLGKIKIFILFFYILLFCAPCNYKLHQHSAPVSDVLSGTCCANTNKHHDKSVIL